MACAAASSTEATKEKGRHVPAVLAPETQSGT